MGRKIPAPKRHFGVKDPLKQLEVREKKLKNVINNPPKKKDFQPTSRSFKKFKDLSKKVATGNFDDAFETAKRKEREKNVAVNDIKQRKNESDIDYLMRAQRLAQQKAEAAAYAAKYNVKMVTDPNTGRVSLKKKGKDEITELMNKNKPKQWVRGRRAQIPKREGPKLTSIEKLKQKKQYKKDLKMEKILEKQVEYDKDEVAFNERVDQPPEITTFPRLATKADTVPRPGAKKSLLLHQVLGKSQSETTTNKGKKLVSPATKVFVEKERESIVQAYRQMKKNRQTNV